MKKTLKAIVLASALTLAVPALASQGNNPEYHFDGDIGSRHVKFYEEDSGQKNVLVVEDTFVSKYATYHSTVHYFDNDDDFKVDNVKIEMSYKKTGEKDWLGDVEGNYERGKYDKEAFEIFQDDFNYYLDRILQEKEG